MPTESSKSRQRTRAVIPRLMKPHDKFQPAE
jgi:hypothetical protein